MKTNDNEPWLVLGASMTALGMAAVRPGSMTIIETSAAPAPEFAGAFYGGNGENLPPVSTQGRALEDELTFHNVLNHGRYHVAALVPVLMRRIMQQNVNCLFWTDLVDITTEADGTLQVAYINASGHNILRVGRIIDTTSESTPAIAPRRWTQKRLWAVLHGEINGTASDGDFLWLPGVFASEQYFGIHLEPDTDWPAARQKLLEAWQNRPAFLKNTRIAAIATEFQYTFATSSFTAAPGVTHLPAASFPTPLLAFEAGVTLAEEMES